MARKGGRRALTGERRRAFDPIAPDENAPSRVILRDLEYLIVELVLLAEEERELSPMRSRATWRCLRADRGVLLRGYPVKTGAITFFVENGVFLALTAVLRSPRLRFSARREAMRFLDRLGRKYERDVAACGRSGDLNEPMTSRTL